MYIKHKKNDKEKKTKVGNENTKMKERKYMTEGQRKKGSWKIMYLFLTRGLKKKLKKKAPSPRNKRFNKYLKKSNVWKCTR